MNSRFNRLFRKEIFMDNNLVVGHCSQLTNENDISDLVYRIDNRPIITHRLNINKVKTFEDVIKVLEGLCIEVHLREGTTCEMYEKLKDYMD
jgi:hypothetical protein